MKHVYTSIIDISFSLPSFSVVLIIFMLIIVITFASDFQKDLSENIELPVEKMLTL